MRRAKFLADQIAETLAGDDTHAGAHLLHHDQSDGDGNHGPCEGRVSRARHLLARPFCILGTPGRGRGYGSKYTVPTINLSRYEELVPKDGVYITCTRVGPETFDSVTNVGNRPTFGADSYAIETHLLNFHPIELTPESEVEICFLERLRDEIKFPSVEALREQIARDVKKARRYFHLLAKVCR